MFAFPIYYLFAKLLDKILSTGLIKAYFKYTFLYLSIPFGMAMGMSSIQLAGAIIVVGLFSYWERKERKSNANSN